MALWREVMVPYTLPYTMTGVRQAIGLRTVGMIAAEFFLSATGLGQLITSASQNFDTGGVFAFDPDHRPARYRFDTAWPRHRTAFRPVETVAMAGQALSTPVPAAHKPAASRWSGAFVPRLITGTCDHPCLGRSWFDLLLQLTSQSRAACCLRSPRSSHTEPVFLQALGSTLLW